MKVLFSIVPLLLLLNACGTSEQIKIYSSPAESVLSYQFDTVYSSYAMDMTNRVTGAPDLHVLDTSLYLVRNYCGAGELIITEFNSTNFRRLLMFNPSCNDVYTKVSSDVVYALLQDDAFFKFTSASRQGKGLGKLMTDSVLNTLGLAIDDYKSGANMYVNVSNNIFYFRVRQNYDTKKGKYSKVRHGYPFVAKYDIETHDIRFFGNVPDYIAEQHYGLNSTIYDLFIGDSIIVSEAPSGKISVINTVTNAISDIEVKSTYDTLPIQKFKMPHKFENRKTAKVEHSLVSPQYGAMYYNPFTQCYYRIFHPAMPREKENGLLNSDYDKQCVLMILDKQFNLIDEKLLPLKTGNAHAILPIKNGVQLYLPELFDYTKEYTKTAYLRIIHSTIKQ